jgi:hypothetical protein
VDSSSSLGNPESPVGGLDGLARGFLGRFNTPAQFFRPCHELLSRLDGRIASTGFVQRF